MGILSRFWVVSTIHKDKHEVHRVSFGRPTDEKVAKSVHLAHCVQKHGSEFAKDVDIDATPTEGHFHK